MRTFTTGAILFVLFFASNTHLQAQTAVGAHAGLNLDNSEFLLGVNARFGLPGLIEGVTLSINPAIETYFIGSGVSMTQFEGNVLYPFGEAPAPLIPYVGAGLAFLRTSIDAGQVGTFSNTDVGLNLLGGVQFPLEGALTPFAQARLTIGGGSYLVLMGGVTYSLW